jgi:serine/threonine-protein kinase RsbW
VTESQSILTFTSPPEDVDTVHDFLEGIWKDMPGGVDEMDRMAFETALIELTSNVIQHGDTGAGVTCRLAVNADERRISARLVDTADGGELSIVTPEMPGQDAESGRGLVLIEMLVDEVRYERVDDRNVWVLTKYRAAS